MKPSLESRLCETADKLRSLAKQIVSPQATHQEWMERAETCEEAANAMAELRRINDDVRAVSPCLAKQIEGALSSTTYTR